MNPGPTLGTIAVVAAYIVVIGSILVYMKMTSNRRKRLERRRKELKD